eukprot:3103052-Prymnesium_polylepis.1
MARMVRIDPAASAEVRGASYTRSAMPQIHLLHCSGDSRSASRTSPQRVVGARDAREFEQRKGEAAREEEHADGGGDVDCVFTCLVGAHDALAAHLAAKLAAVEAHPHPTRAERRQVAEEADPHPADEEGERVVQVPLLDGTARRDHRVRERRVVPKPDNPADSKQGEEQRGASVLEGALHRREVVEMEVGHDK